MNFPIDLPEDFLEKASRLKVFAEDIEEKFVRGSGAGGQKINKTSSCVWLRHLPSGTEVKCQKHRERGKNRVSAYKLLIKKIETEKLGKKSEQAKKIFKLQKQKKRRSRRAKEKMLDDKKRVAVKKEFRRPVKPDKSA
ncbi:MAG: peptide chain release factor-like protein [Patescibacteria group bacterium]|nr:peptide chain release factor-like protein [Patescibacteria group bacterium]